MVGRSLLTSSEGGDDDYTSKLLFAKDYVCTSTSRLVSHAKKYLLGHGPTYTI